MREIKHIHRKMRGIFQLVITGESIALLAGVWIIASSGGYFLAVLLGGIVFVQAAVVIGVISRELKRLLD